MANGRLGQWLQMLVCVLILLKTEGFYVGITYVQNAVAKGAVCLDGSPPTYHLDKGFGAGINNWLVHFEVGPSFTILFYNTKMICLLLRR
ncbi:unnamed protein product [Camellia sinensis]